MDASPEKQKNITIDRELCKGCGICVAFCPEGVLALNGDEKAEVIHPERCTSCGMCELRCPDMAIESPERGPKADE